MKKIIAAVAAIALVFSLAGCEAGKEIALISSQIQGYFTLEKDWDSIPCEQINDVGGKTKYYFNLLTNREKHAYNNILSEIDLLPERIEVPEMDSDSLTTVFEALLFDNPLLLQLGRACNIITAGKSSYFTTEYVLTLEEFTAQKQAVQEAAKKIIESAPMDTNDYEKELYIHDKIIDICSYTHNEKLEESTVYGTLVNGKASCEGYSKAAKYLFDLVGIESFVIGGMAQNADKKNEGHMWNVVKINGEFYNLDLTWDDPVSQDNVDEPRYSYFNLTDADISKTHSEFEKKYSCTATAENYYIKSGLLFDKYSEDTRTKVADRISAAVNSGRESVEIKFSSEDVYKTAIDGLFEKEQIYRILSIANVSTDKRINTERTYYIQNDDYFVIEIIVLLK